MNDGLADRILDWGGEHILPWAVIGLAVLMAAFVIWLVCFGVYCWIVGDTPLPMRGIVIGKNHRPSHTSYVPVQVGKMTIMQPRFHPEQWDIVIQEEGTTGGAGQHLVVVTHDRWNDLKVGDVWQRSDTIYEAAE